MAIGGYGAAGALGRGMNVIGERMWQNKQVKAQLIERSKERDKLSIRDMRALLENTPDPELRTSLQETLIHGNVKNPDKEMARAAVERWNEIRLAYPGEFDPETGFIKVATDTNADDLYVKVKHAIQANDTERLAQLLGKDKKTTPSDMQVESAQTWLKKNKDKTYTDWEAMRAGKIEEAQATSRAEVKEKFTDSVKESIKTMSIEDLQDNTIKTGNAIKGFVAALRSGSAEKSDIENLILGLPEKQQAKMREMALLRDLLSHEDKVIKFTDEERSGLEDTVEVLQMTHDLYKAELKNKVEETTAPEATLPEGWDTFQYAGEWKGNKISGTGTEAKQQLIDAGASPEGADKWISIYLERASGVDK